MKASNRRLLSPLLLWFMGTMILANIAEPVEAGFCLLGWQDDRPASN